jgi:hypothetical protein
MPLTNAEKQAELARARSEKRKRHHVARSVHFRRQHHGAPQADRLSQELLVTSLIKEEAASAVRRITHQLSGKAQKRYCEE